MDSPKLPLPSIRARVIKDGNSVAIRLPASLGLKAGEELDIDLRRVNVWPEGYFDLEAIPDFPMPERTSPEAREDRKKRIFGDKGSL